MQFGILEIGLIILFVLLVCGGAKLSGTDRLILNRVRSLLKCVRGRRDRVSAEKEESRMQEEGQMP